MIPNMIVFGNGKGGVYKSSMTANVAGLTAAGGWRVLAIDTDPQDHLSLNLGVRDMSDHGVGLHNALINGDRPMILKDVRPGLDLIPNGEKGEATIGGLTQRVAAGDLDAFSAFDRMTAPLAPDYDLILVDTPPGEKMLQHVVMAAAGQVIVPTRVDAGSREGLDRVCRDILKVERLNPHLVLMGVVGVGLSRASKGMKRQAHDQLRAAVDGVTRVFDSFIHTVDKAVIDGLETGRLAHEYEQAADAEFDRLNRLKYSERIETWRSGDTPTFSVAAGGLAEDYSMLTNELLAAYTAIAQRRAGVSA